MIEQEKNERPTQGRGFNRVVALQFLKVASKEVDTLPLSGPLAALRHAITPDDNFMVAQGNALRTTIETGEPFEEWSRRMEQPEEVQTQLPNVIRPVIVEGRVLDMFWEIEEGEYESRQITPEEWMKAYLLTENLVKNLGYGDAFKVTRRFQLIDKVNPRLIEDTIQFWHPIMPTIMNLHTRKTVEGMGLPFFKRRNIGIDKITIKRR